MAEGIKISELEEVTNYNEECCLPIVSNGVNKKIKAINLGGGYSTAEKIVGKFIDGKPIYKKTFDLSTEAIITKEYYKEGNSDMVRWNIDVDFTSLNIDSLLSYKEIKTDLNYTNQHGIKNQPSLRYKYFYNENNRNTPIENINVEHHTYKTYESNYNFYAAGYIIIEYTKTTDNVEE